MGPLLISRRLSRLLVAGLFSLFFLSIFFYLFFRKPSAEDNSEPSTQDSENLQSSLVVLKNFHRTESSQTPGKGWEITAALGEYDTATQKMALTASIVRLADKEGKPTTIKANKANITFEGETLLEVTANGAVEVIHGPDLIIKTEQARYEKKSEHITSLVPVTLLGEMYTIKADTMDFDIASSQALLSSNVQSVFELGKEQKGLK